MIKKFYFNVLRYYLSELFLFPLFWSLKIKPQLQFSPLNLLLCISLLQLLQLIAEFVKMKQQIFYTTSMANFVSPLNFWKRSHQLYADRHANLWGISNKQIFNAKLVTKGLEAKFNAASGLVINTAFVFTSRLPFRYLWRSENVLASVNLIPGIDYPLFFQPLITGELFLLRFFQKFIYQQWDQSRYYYFSLFVSVFLKNKISFLNFIKYKN